MGTGAKSKAGRFFYTGLAHQQAGQLAEARQCYEKGLKYDPGNPDALFLLGQTLFAGGETEAGERRMRAAISARPQAGNYHAGLAFSLFSAGRSAEAEQEFRLAARIVPDDPSLWQGLALSAVQNGALPAAREAAGQWLRLVPNDAEAIRLHGTVMAQHHFEQGIMFADGGQGESAALEYEAALRFDPEALPILVNLANLRASLGQPEKARELYERAIALSPDYAPAHFNLGMLHLDNGQRLDAATALERAAACDPEDGLAAAHLLFQKMHLCRWDGIDELSRRVRTAVEQDTADIPPFIVLSMPGTTPQLQRKCAENHSLRLSRHEAPSRRGGDRLPGNGTKRLRVGYLSSDFKSHATAFLMIEMLEAHDRSRFEIYCLSYGIDDHSTIRERIVAGVEHFVELAGLPESEAAARIAELNLDVLIDLKGYTEGNHSKWLRSRPAPVQINWLGYPGSMGAPWIDYLLADETVAPPENQWMYSERLLYLPGCYQPNCRERECGAAVTRAGEGLPDDAIVLCSFNQTYKITPEVFSIWLDVLREAPGTVLWLWASNPWAENALHRIAEENGVSAARLVFAEGKPQAQHLARLPLADLALDAFPCNGHTTTSDALWAGVPVVTLQGEAFASRVAASLLAAAGLGELIAANRADYRRLILDFCRQAEWRRQVRQRARELREHSALFDGWAFARKLEDLLDGLAARSTS